MYAYENYNYGGGYVGYVAGKGKKHTFNLAENFARDKSSGQKVTYTNPIAVAKNGGLALWLWKYVLCGACEPVPCRQSSIGRTGTKDNE